MYFVLIQKIEMIICTILCYSARTETVMSTFYDVNFGVYATETCNGEHLDVNCEENNVVLLLSANYGRMGYGRCITANTLEEEIHTNKSLGCYVDVLSHLNNNFSNYYQKIIFNVAELDPIFNKKTKCGKDLKLHLYFSYHCIPVLSPSSNCQHDIKTNPVYISSHVSSCGSSIRPWSVKVKNGKTMKLTILWFKNDDMDKSIIQVIDMRKHLLELKGFSNSYDINSSEARIIIIKQKSDKFLVKLEEIGCSDVILPPIYTTIRSGNQSLVKCINSDTQWTVVCENGTWSGRHDNCIPKTKFLESLTLSIVLVIAVIIVAGLVVLCVSFNFYRRHSLESAQMAISNATYGPGLGLGLGQAANVEMGRKILNDVALQNSQHRIYYTNEENRFGDRLGLERTIPMNFNSSLGSISRLDSQSQKSIYSLQYDNKFSPLEHFSTVRIPGSLSQRPCLSKASSVSVKNRKKYRNPGLYQLNQQQKQHHQPAMATIHATGSVPQFPVSGEDHLPHWSCHGFYNQCDCSADNIYNLPEGFNITKVDDKTYYYPRNSFENPQYYHSIPEASGETGSHIDDEPSVNRSNGITNTSAMNEHVS